MFISNNKKLYIQVPDAHFSAYGLFLFFLLLPFEYPLQKIGVGSILRYVGILTMGLAALDLYLERRIRMDYRVILIVMWCVYAVVSGLWCLDKTYFNRYISMYINNAMMFVMVTLVPFSLKEREFVEKGLVGGVILLLCYMTFIPGSVVSSSWQSRLTLAYRGEELLDQNYLSALMLMPYGCLLFDVISKKDHRGMKALVCLGILYYVLRTGSRSGLLGISAITMLHLYRGAKRKSLIVYALFFSLIMIGPWIIRLLPSDLLDRFSLEAMTGNTSESGGRLEIWAAAWAAIKDSFVFTGYGAGSSEFVIRLYYVKSAAIHNFVLAHVVELGLIGLVLFSTIIVKMIQQLYVSNNEKICTAFVGIIVVGFFLDLLTTKFFWASLMLVSVNISSHKSLNKQREKLDDACI